MTIALTATPTGPTSGSLALANIGANTGAIEVQYGAREDFQFCVAPVFTVAAAATIAVANLNQAAQYFFRVRENFNDNTVGDWSNVYGITTPLGTARVLLPPGLSVAPAWIVPPATVLAWTSQSERAGYPARALGRDNPAAVFAATTASNVASFEMQTGGEPVDTIALLDTNIPESATIVVKAAATLAAVRSSPAYVTTAAAFRASPNMPGRLGYHGIIRLPAPQSYPFWRVEVTAAVPGGVVVITYAVVGLARVGFNISAGAGESMTDLGSITRDRTGLPDRTVGIVGRSSSFTISLMTDEQFETIFGGFARRAGITRSMLVVPNSKAGPLLHDRLLYGPLRSFELSKPYSRKVTLSVECDSLI